MNWLPVLGFLLCCLLGPAVAGSDKLLVVLSEASSITLKNGKQHPTGYFLSELMVPVEEIARLGCEIVVATPTGKTPTVDRSSESQTYFQNEAEYQRLRAVHSSMATIKAPLSLTKLDEKQLSSFDGVFFPGGHAPVTDLANNADVARVLRHFHDRALPTALICHGPVALLAARAKDAPWPYRGYRMTGFSTAEEKVAESGALGGEMPFYLEEALKESGGLVTVGPLWKSKAVRDRELITGQNPASDRELAQHLLIALAETRLKKATRVVDHTPGLAKFEPGQLVQVTPFPKDWRSGVTNVYIGARRPEVDRDRFQKVLGAHLDHARRVYGPVGMRGYLVLSDGDGEIAFMNWASREKLDGAKNATGREECAREAAEILDQLVLDLLPDPARLEHPLLK
ncbi:MAG: type 1 glutamine amidotransferase domain-containing protein [Candidatus Riflebacteria bacterium]|nr:type 1 glutamine amidotransferase domain-containing protein [Candidatus Riflebacteria bacterium]